MVKSILIIQFLVVSLFADFFGEIGTRSDYLLSPQGSQNTYTKVYSRLQYKTEYEMFELNFLGRGYLGAEETSYHNAWIDELTISKEYENYSFLFGKHQVNWGESDYYRLVNVINPIDLRDYFLSYLEDYKKANISLWMLQNQYIADEWSITLLLIPDFEETGMPQTETGFSNQQIELYNSLKSNQPKDFKLKDSSIAAKIESSIGENDVALYSYYGWNHTPVVISAEKKKNFRRKMLGATLSRVLDNIVLRLETSVSLNDVLQTSSFEVKKADVSKSLVGIDWSKGNNTINIQFLHTYIYDGYQAEMLDDKNFTELSVYMEANIYNNNITFSNLLLHKFNTQVGMNEFKIKYRYTDELNIYLGYDSFWGDEEMLSGYNEQNRFSLNLKYFF